MKKIFFILLSLAATINSIKATFEEDLFLRKNCLIINWQPFGDYRETLKKMKDTNVFMIADSSLPQEEVKNLKTHMKEIILIDNYFGGLLELTVLELNSRHKIDTIVAFDEFDLLRASRLRENLNIKIGQNYESAVAFRDKFLMKNILQEKSKISLPKFAKVDSALDLIEFSKFGFPIVVKPRKGAGAERTYVLKNQEDLSELVKNRNLFGHYHNSNLIAEEFIDGEMFNVNGFVINGKMIYAWPNKYVNTCLDMVHGKILANYTLPSSNKMVKRLLEFSEEILTVLPTPINTSFHLELFHSKEGKLVFCEVGSRLCGGMAYMDWFSAFGIDIVGEDLLIQSGSVDSWKERELPKEPLMVSGHVEFPSQKGVLISIPEERWSL